MIRILFLLCLFNSSISFTQIKVYIGQQKFPNDLIYEIKNNIAYRVTNPALKGEYLYIEGEKVYFRDRKSFVDVKYSISSDAIYKGNSTSTFDKLFTLKDQQLFIGDSNFSSDCLYTFKDGMIYRGDSTSAFDAFMSYEISKEEDLIFIAMLIAPY